MSKQPTSFDYSANAQGLLKTGVDLAAQKAKMLQHKPTGYEAEANLFKNIRAGMTGKRKPWHQTVSEGLINGAEYGLQSKQVESKKAEYDKVENFFNYFEQTLACLNYDNNRNAQQTKLIENARPYAMGMLNKNFSGLSYEQANQSNQELFQQAKLNNPNLKGDYVGFIQATDTLLIRRENGEILPFSLATLLPEDAIKDARQAQIDRQNANSHQMNAQAHMMSAHTGQDNSRIAQERLHMEQEYAPKEQEDRTRRLDIMQQNAHQRLEALGVKSVKEIAPKYEAAIMGKKICEDLIKEAKDNPQVFGSIASAVVNTKGDSNALRLWAEKTFVDPKQRSAAMRVAKGIASLQLQDAKAMGGQNNMTLDAMIQQMIPNGQYDPDNFIYIMEEFKNKYQFRIDTTRDFLRQPSNSYVGESYDNHMQDFENRSKTNRDNLDNPNKFSKHSPEQLEVRKQQLEQEIMSKK